MKTQLTESRKKEIENAIERIEKNSPKKNKDRSCANVQKYMNRLSKEEFYFTFTHTIDKVTVDMFV